MGLFSNPKKAMKGFFRDPIGKVCTDINRAVGIENKNDTPKTIQCKEQCVDNHLLKTHSKMDKKYFDKNMIDITNGIVCVKKCESVYNNPAITGKK